MKDNTCARAQIKIPCSLREAHRRYWQPRSGGIFTLGGCLLSSYSCCNIYHQRTFSSLVAPLYFYKKLFIKICMAGYTWVSLVWKEYKNLSFVAIFDKIKKSKLSRKKLYNKSTTLVKHTMTYLRNWSQSDYHQGIDNKTNILCVQAVLG